MSPAAAAAAAADPAHEELIYSELAVQDDGCYQKKATSLMLATGRTSRFQINLDEHQLINLDHSIDESTSWIMIILIIIQQARQQAASTGESFMCTWIMPN